MTTTRAKWSSRPELGSRLSRDGSINNQSDYRIHRALFYPEVFKLIRRDGVLWTYQYEPDEPISHPHKRTVKRPDAVLPFTQLELVIKEYVCHNNTESLARYLLTVTPQQYRKVVSMIRTIN